MLSQVTFTRAAELVLREAKGFGHNTFKIDLARRSIVRALSQAARAWGGVPATVRAPLIARTTQCVDAVPIR